MNGEIKEVISIEKRWEEGIKHDARSIEIMSFLKDYDFKFCNDTLCWKTGGDGDNGELLMYELDEFFASPGAGYRKQSDTIKEFAGKLKSIYLGREKRELHTRISFLFDRIDEIAKEYGAEDTK